MTDKERDRRDLRICEMLDKGMSYTAIQKATGATPVAISKMVKALREHDQDNSNR